MKVFILLVIIITSVLYVMTSPTVATASSCVSQADFAAFVKQTYPQANLIDIPQGIVSRNTLAIYNEVTLSPPLDTDQIAIIKQPSTSLIAVFIDSCVEKFLPIPTTAIDQLLGSQI